MQSCSLSPRSLSLLIHRRHRVVQRRPFVQRPLFLRTARLRLAQSPRLPLCLRRLHRRPMLGRERCPRKEPLTVRHLRFPQRGPYRRRLERSRARRFPRHARLQRHPLSPVQRILRGGINPGTPMRHGRAARSVLPCSSICSFGNRGRSRYPNLVTLLR